MSISVEVNEKQLRPESILQMHYLPAAIKGDGPANVDKYFNNYTRSQDDIKAGLLMNSLRGYPLLGENLIVPSGYNGLVVQETRQSLDDSETRQLHVTGTFDKFTYWNYDKIPSNADGYNHAMQMLHVANALSMSVREDELENEQKCNET